MVKYPEGVNPLELQSPLELAVVCTQKFLDDPGLRDVDQLTELIGFL